MLADDIALVLEQAGIGTRDTDLFVAYLPESPDNCMAIYETGGVQPDTELPFRSPTFQVHIRNNSYATGRAKLDSVRLALHAQQNITVNQTYYYYILANAEGGHIGRDDNGRDEFSINFRAKTRDVNAA